MALEVSSLVMSNGLFEYPLHVLEFLMLCWLGSTTEELCARWMELGAFYPFSRNHNIMGSPPQVSNCMHELYASFYMSRDNSIAALFLLSFPLLQEPYRWSSVAAISRKVLSIRYSLLPYYYSLFFMANHDPNDYTFYPSSGVVVKPLFFEFPSDPTSLYSDKQFLVGSALLITPQLKLGECKYCPSSPLSHTPAYFHGRHKY